MTFAENTVTAAPYLLDNDVVFTAGFSLSGGRLVVAGLLPEDRVSILTEGFAAGQIGLAGSTVLYGGVVIGNTAGGIGGTFTVNFNAAVTGAAVDALIQRLSYANVSDTPTRTRTLTLDVVDASGGHPQATPTPQFTALSGAANPFDGFDVGGFSAPAFVDLNADGRLDLVSGAADGTLLAWRNTGSGFTALTGAANPFNSFGVLYSGDLYNSTPTFVDDNGDGRPDLVSGSHDRALVVWLNTGSGFTETYGLNLGIGNITPCYVDLDGDGRLDLVSGAADGTLLAGRNIGGGFFDPLTGAANPFDGFDVGTNSAPTFVDLDVDGRLDLVSGASDGTLLAWRNTGSGFTALTGAANPFNGIDVGYDSKPAFVDLDGDGRVDLVSGTSDGTLLAWRNTTPLPAITVTVTPATDAREIATLTGFAPAVTFAENTVNAAPQLLDSDVVFTAGFSLAGGRLVVAGLLAEDRVSILTQGSFAWQIGFDGSTVRYGGVVIGTATGGVGETFTVDFNGAVTGAAVDALIQRLSYANVSETPTSTRTLTLDVVDASGGHLAATPTPQFTALTGGANPLNGFDVGTNSAPAFVDLDFDGRLDLVSGEGFGGLLAWRNTGSGFAALTGAANPFNGFDVGILSKPAFVDLDGDGRLDLVSGEVTGTLLAWRNTSFGFIALTGTANPFDGIDVGAGSTPCFVDLDGDRRLDLVSGAYTGALLAWRNTGNGFTALTGAANPFNGIDVGSESTPAFVDLDGDGRVDLVSGGFSGTLLAWRNTGSGFTALTGAANPFDGIDVGTYSMPAFVDLDGDGRLDLVSGAGNGALLAWRNTTPLPAITVTVTSQNDVPVITSAATALSAENRPAGTIVYQAAATDPDASPTSITWSLSGTDAARFTIDRASGAVRFKAAPDFEAPADAGGNNVYDIVVGADDGSAVGTKAVAITVTDVPEITTITGFAPAVTFAENTVNAAPQLLDSDVVFTAGDSLSGGRLVVAGLLAEDRVSILTEGFAAGQIGLVGSTVGYGGVVIGTATGGVGGTFTVDFNAAVTGAAVDALIQRLSYANVSQTPTLTRMLTLDVVDALGEGMAGFGPFPALSGMANPFDGFDAGDSSTHAFVDLDGDGDLDLVSGEGYGTFLAWLNTGTAAAPVFTALSGTDNPFDTFNVEYNSRPAFLDLDGDGDLDFVSGNLDGTFLAWRNDGSSGFIALTRTDNPFYGFDVGSRSTPAFVDLDGDGDLDLVSGASSGRLLAWHNIGTAASPVFTALSGTDNPFDGFDVGQQSTPAFVDLDGDGALDVVSGERYGTFLAWRNTGTAAAPDFTALSGTDNPFDGFVVGNGSAPAFVDLDGDGNLDLVSGNLDGAFPAWRNAAQLPAITVTITPQNDAPAGALRLGAVEGPLRLDASVTDADGLGSMVLSWQSSADGGATWQAIIGAAGAQFAPALAQAGLLVRGLASYVDGGGTAEAVASDTAARIGTDGADALVAMPGVALLYGLGGADSLTGMAGTETLVGGAGADRLNGGLGADRMVGGADNDTYVVDDPADDVVELANEGYDRAVASISHVLDAEVEWLSLSGTANLNGTGNALANRLDGNAGANRLDGGEGNDALNGSAGADTLTGGLGDDRMTGGLGVDHFVVDAGSDTITDLGLGGADVLEISAGATVNVTVVAPWAATAASSNAGIANLVAGGFGVDVALAAGGNGWSVSNAGNATGIRLSGSLNADSLTGGEGSDTLLGNSGDDTLDGGTGADSLVGGAGDETYVVDNVLDRLRELRLGGMDTVLSSVSFTLTAELEDLILTGDTATNGTGNTLANRIIGNGAANVLNGGRGADTLIGGAGDDLYRVDALDRVVESAGGGADTVSSTGSFSLDLMDHIEVLQLTGGAVANGIGNAGDNRILGNVAANILTGGLGNDLLQGGAGDDTLRGGEGADTLIGSIGTDRLEGGAGNDVYVIADLDSIGEAADGGIDLVQASITFILAGHVENLSLTGAAAIDGTGSSRANLLTGNGMANKLDGLGGADILSGANGNDTLIGGQGADTLTGGPGADTFRFLAVSDRGDVITDYAASDDTLEFSAAGFGGGLVAGMGLGVAGRFVSNLTGLADAALGQFIFETDARKLWWDADGTGAEARFEIVQMQGVTSLAASEIVVIA